jgi:hypothetical protein
MYINIYISNAVAWGIAYYIVIKVYSVLINKSPNND